MCKRKVRVKKNIKKHMYTRKIQNLDIYTLNLHFYILQFVFTLNQSYHLQLVQLQNNPILFPLHLTKY